MRMDKRVLFLLAGLSTGAAHARAEEASAHCDRREYDAVVASGEQVTAGLLAIVLRDQGIPARSWQGWQIPIHTDNAHGGARISDIDGSELVRRFVERGEVAVITGFQGIHKDTRRTNLPVLFDKCSLSDKYELPARINLNTTPACK